MRIVKNKDILLGHVTFTTGAFCKRDVYLVELRFAGAKQLFISLLVFLHYVHSYTTHSFIATLEFRFSFLIAVSSGEGLNWGAAPRFELRAALQQPNAPPTNPLHMLILFRFQGQVQGRRQDAAQ